MITRHTSAETSMIKAGHDPTTQPTNKKDLPTNFSDTVQLDPDNQLHDPICKQFRQVLQKFDPVFNPDIPRYNGAAGHIEATVNMGPVQHPQRKGRVPQYSRISVDKFDELERAQVFQRPENIGLTVEYLNLSFLVKKPSASLRLVTAFADVGRYREPQPSLMPDVDSSLRTITSWKYLIKIDLTRSFFQIPLSRSSIKYCGVSTSFRGIRVYARSAMGMPGSETALEVTCSGRAYSRRLRSETS